MKDQSIRLLIIDDSMSDAERFSSTLRNAGIAVRTERVDDVEDMILELKEAEYDLILAANELLDFDAKMAYIEAHKINPNLPVIIISENKTEEMLINLMAAGITDVISKQNLNHLAKVVEREFKSVQAITQASEFKQAYKETEARCSHLMESSRDAIAYLSEGMHIHANSVYVNKFGFEIAEELEGVPVLDMISPDDHAAFKKFLRKYEKKRDGNAEYEVKGRYSDDSLFDATMEFSPASIEGEPCIQLIIRDRSNNKELEEKIAHLTNQDMLTNLYNRQYFLESMGQTLHDESQNTGTEALLYIMMDNFKEVRQQAGMTGSDHVITEIANIIKSSTDQTDTLARLDDYSFVIFSSVREAGEVQSLAESICKQIKEHSFENSGQFITTECSIGVSYAGKSHRDINKLIAQSEATCEKANTAGGNQVMVFVPDSSDTSTDEWQDHMSDLVIKSMANGQMTLNFQPIVSLQGDPDENYCVLLRLRDDDGKVIMPTDFFPAAKKKGIDIDIDRWVIRQSIKTLSEHRKQGRNINFFITLSGESLEDKSLIIWVLDCLKEFTLRPDCLVFQVSDYQVRKHLQAAKEFLQGIKKIKARFAIDNFELDNRAGNLIKTFPADYIKLKGEISMDLATNVDNQSTIKEASKLAKSNNMNLIAKSVEDANCLAVLWGTGVDYIQGFFLQEPAESLSYDFTSDGM
ncbi:MAG: EAL domain-containing protein [Methylococcales bacterium]|nr:EAL domain-containing protein [Methylococcales bacterium]